MITKPKFQKVSRKYHPWWNWECYKAGFFNTAPPNGIDNESALVLYKDYLSDLHKFKSGILKVFSNWPNSCEQFLTNPGMNRIAWLGQAAACIDLNLPSCFRGGFKLLSNEEQEAADNLAATYLTEWLKDFNERN